MIYLEESNLLFLKPFKVAGSSFEIALSKFSTEKDIVSEIQRDEPLRRSLGYPGPANFKYTWSEIRSMPIKLQIKLAYHKHLRIKFPQHTSAHLARERLGRTKFDSALKVSIVRNPFDYLISHYYWDNRRREATRDGFPRWLRQNPWVFTGNDQFYYIDNQEIIDYFIRFEHLNDDLRHLESIKPDLKGLHNAFSQVKAKSNTRPPNSSVQDLFFSQDDLVRAVAFFQYRHLKRFGYTVPGCTQGTASCDNDASKF